MRNSSRFPWITVVALLGACAAAEGDPQLDFATATIQQEPAVSDVAAEAVALYQELAARLDARSVTIEEMQAAVDAGDEEAVREMFGMTPEEYDEANARALAVAANVIASDETIEAHPEGLSCEWGIMECGAPFMLFAWTQPQFGAAILVFGAAICGISRCSWDDGSGPRPKQP